MKNKINELVEQNYQDPNFDVNKLADMLGVSRSYLNTRCQYNLDCTPHALIEKTRIDKAKILFQINNNGRIICVWKKVGFCNRKTFYNAFKKNTGQTPREFINTLYKK